MLSWNFISTSNDNNFPWQISIVYFLEMGSFLHFNCKYSRAHEVEAVAIFYPRFLIRGLPSLLYVEKAEAKRDLLIMSL